MQDEGTITVWLLDREVVLRERGEQHWASDCDTVSVRKYPDTSWRVGFSLCAVCVVEYSESLRDGIAAVDTKLRALREWLR